jgi:hypothetical protein
MVLGKGQRIYNSCGSRDHLNTTLENFQHKRYKAVNLEAEANPVNPKIYDLDYKLAEAIRSGNVGSDLGSACVYKEIRK